MVKNHYWGPEGVYNFYEFQKRISSGSFSLYQINDSILYFNIIFFMGLVIAILYTIGFKPRITGILNFIFIWSLYERNFFLLDGGNNILIICLFFLIFANVGGYFAITKSPETKNRYLSALHNISIVACILQVSTVYFFSGMFKAQGDLWFNGVSLYYILQVNEFTLPQIASLIYGNPFILTVGTISAVIIQIAFPFLILSRWMRGITVILMIMFHLGIMVVMGLFSFGLTMIFLDTLILNDNYYRQFYYRLQNLLNGLKTKLKKSDPIKSVS